MKRIRFLILSIALVALVACTISVPSPQVTTRGATVHESGEFFEAELLVGYRDGLTAQDVANELNASILADWPMLHAVHLKLPENISISKAQKILNGNDKIVYAIKNKLFQREPQAANGYTPMAFTTQATINDPEYARQWQHRQINSEGAWDLGVSGSGIRIGIHDDYVDHEHPDLFANILYPGFDGFLRAPINIDTPHDGIGFHGTPVAGKAAAAANSKGGRGVAYEASIVPLSISEPENGSLAQSAIVNSAIFAVIGPDGKSPIFDGDEDTDSAPGTNAYVHIVNMSWGGGTYDQIIKDSMDLMLQHGIVLVTSAGNTPTLAFAEPAWHPGIITVAATRPDGTRTEFSNRGPHLDVAAPGDRTWTTATRACVFSTPDRSSCTGDEVDHDYFGGTSSSSPAVAGVAALVMEALAEKDASGKITAVPSASQVRKIISETAKQSNLASTATERNDNLGYGIVDAEAAVKRAQELSIATAPRGASLVVNAVVKSDTSIGLPKVGVTLIPTSGNAPTKYTQTADGSFVWATGQALFQQVDAGEYRIVASGPHTSELGVEAATASANVTLEPGTVTPITLEFDIVPFADPNEPNDSTEAAAAITVGTTTRASLFSDVASSDIDVYSFTATEGTSYRVNLEKISGSADTNLRILAADGTTVLAENDNNQEHSTDSLVEFTATASANVFVEVTDLSGSNNRFNIYEIDLATVAGDETEPNGSASVNDTNVTGVVVTDAQTVVLGAALNASLDPATDDDIFELSVLAGDTVVVDTETARSGEPDTLVVIYDSELNEVARNDDFTGRESRVTYTSEEAATYYIVVVAWNGDDPTAGTTGSYNPTFTRHVNP